MEQMTEYEGKRLENVQRNRQMLAAVRVHDTAESLRSATKKPKSETKAYKPPKREREVLRRSLRTRGLSPQRNGSPAARREGFTPPSSFSKPPTSLRKGPLHLAETYASYGEEDTYDHYFNRLRELRDSEGRGLVGPKVSPEDLKLEAKDIATLAPNKILSVHILPCRERAIVVGGDREGYLSLWVADCEEEGKSFHMYLPHSAAVSGIMTAPCSVEKVLSCSYDGFIRCMDIEKEVFDMLYTNNRRLSAICCAPHGYQSAYFAEAYGEMKVLDLRVQGVSNSYALHEKPINSIDFHPYNPHLVFTSSTDCTASIWDLRNIGKNQTKSIATVRHESAVHSAYFSPSGNYLATSYNGNVGLSNGLDSWNTTMIYDSNPLRTRIPFFRAVIWGLDCRTIWGWDDNYLFIGNMERALDAICTSTKITTSLHSPLIRAIPSRLAKHPFSHGISFGAIGSGQVFSCSYDGFIRCMDIEKEVFDMLYTNNRRLSAICCAPHGYQSAYFAEEYGEMKVLDLRVQGVSNSYTLHEKRINSIDFHPYNPHLVSTSSTDCTASIWDLRNIGKNQTKSIATMRHESAVHSAYFSPSGNYLATSYNGNVGLSNGLDSWNTTMIYQSNPLRTRIPFYRAAVWGLDCRSIWGWDDRYLFIGNLERALDAICTSTKITTTLHSPLIKAIPCRLAKHPFSHGILAGALGSGQVCVWRKH